MNFCPYNENEYEYDNNNEVYKWLKINCALSQYYKLFILNDLESLTKIKDIENKYYFMTVIITFTMYLCNELNDESQQLLINDIQQILYQDLVNTVNDKNII